ncbi:cadherin repeat domain-containing protein, partial [Mycoplana sp. MJR14]|uniref:cadherin repeat domain-containing protein n=1 Tax=Mycoplana sp. MJR14 TaxID=3032583 RepID=UPI0023DC03C5
MTETAISNINSAGTPTVTALANGTFVVAWQTTVDGNVGLVGRIYDANHNPVSAEFSIETTGAGTQSSAGLVALDSGGFLAVWQSADGQEPDTSGNGVRARAFTDTGVPVADDYTINATVTGNQNAPTGVTLDDGRILLAWQSADAEGSDSSETGIRAVILNADGSPAGSEFVVNTVTEAGQLTPSVAALADGGYVIAWTLNDTAGSDTSGGVIRATHFDANGEVVGTADFEVNSTTNGAQSNVKIAALADGGYVITWRSADGADSDIRARVFDADGTATGDDFVANSTTAGNQLTPSISTLDDGRFLMVWSSAESPAVIRGRVFESDGAPVGEDFVVNSTQGTTAALPTVSTLDDGNVVVTWRTTLSGVSTVMAKTLDLTDYVGNHAPTELALSASQVDENAPDGTVVGILSAADSDGDALTYTLTDDADGLFSLVTESGETRLVVSGALDYETAATHDVTVKVADGRGGEVTKTFSVTVADVDDTDPVDPPEQRGTITIDASGSNGMDFEAFVRGGFVSDVSSGGFPVFDNSAAFSGEEMFIGYGTDSTSKYVLAHGDLQYAFGTHTVAGTIGTIEYGTRGSGTYDGNGYFIGGNVALRITGLDLANAVPTNSTEEAAIEATGEVHNFASAHMTSTQSRL